MHIKLKIRIFFENIEFKSLNVKFLSTMVNLNTPYEHKHQHKLSNCSTGFLIMEINNSRTLGTD